MSGATIPQARLTSLDAVRGIAACAVVLSHCYLLLPEPERARLDGAPWAVPLLPFHNGNAAVVIFFLLSGYVLALPFFRGTQLGYPQYVVRRVCRIYIPFAASILLALLLFALSSHAPVPAASDWFNTLWPSGWPGAPTVAGHLLMLGTGPDMALNPSMWTLVYEMRVSLVFPLLVLACRDTRIALVVILGLIVGSRELLGWMGENNHPSYATTVWATLPWTGQVAAYFLTGILLGKHRERISRWFGALPPALRVGAFAVPFAVFCLTPTFSSAKTNLLYDLGAAVLIVLAIESRRLRAFLDGPVPQWLGRISYSLYLIHLPLILAVVPWLMGRVPFPVVVAAVMAGSLGAATAMHAAVEVPAIKLGHRLTRRGKRRGPQPALSGA